jgi:hypothetical protein
VLFAVAHYIETHPLLDILIKFQSRRQSFQLITPTEHTEREENKLYRANLINILFPEQQDWILFFFARLSAQQERCIFLESECSLRHSAGRGAM